MAPRSKRLPRFTSVDRALAAFATFLLLAIALLWLTGCSTAAGYVQKGQEIISADNLEEQHDRVIREWRSLTTAADNACAAQAQGDRDDAAPTLVESPALAYAATYRTVWAEYNARTENIFEAGFVGPVGYPKNIPNFVTGPNPDFCGVSAQLAQLKAQSEAEAP
jgi:hypothetical protein